MLIVHCTSASPSMSIAAALSGAISWCATLWGQIKRPEQLPSGISYKRAKPFSFSFVTPISERRPSRAFAADRSKHRNPPLGALLFSCCGRGEGLFGQAHHDSRVVQERIGPIPVAGFFAQGEIGPVGGKTFFTAIRQASPFSHGRMRVKRHDQADKGALMPSEQAGPEGKEVTTSSGLQYLDLKVGTGATAQAGQTVTVHYTGWLENGKKFDSSIDRGQPFSFPLGGGV